METRNGWGVFYPVVTKKQGEFADPLDGFEITFRSINNGKRVAGPGENISLDVEARPSMASSNAYHGYYIFVNGGIRAYKSGANGWKSDVFYYAREQIRELLEKGSSLEFEVEKAA